MRELVAQPDELTEPVETVGVMSPPVQVEPTEPGKAEVTQTPDEMPTPVIPQYYPSRIRKRPR